MLEAVLGTDHLRQRGHRRITVAEAAERLKAGRQTIYNLTARLQREGRLRKDGRGFYAAESPTAEAPEPPPASASL